MKIGEAEGLHDRVYAVVSRIPKGRIATYGQIAHIAGMPRQARLVGYALHALPPNTRVPWHRVVNSQGAISTPPRSAARQRQLLEEEGVKFDARDRIPLEAFQWTPRTGRRESPSRSDQSMRAER
jgi:methylated-DNA-protein-cysteine methyltransferase related protein